MLFLWKTWKQKTKSVAAYLLYSAMLRQPLCQFVLEATLVQAECVEYLCNTTRCACLRETLRVKFE